MSPVEPPPAPSAPEGPVPEPLRGGRAGALAVGLAAAVFVALVLLDRLGARWADPPASITAALTFLPYLVGLYATALVALWIGVADRRGPPALLLCTMGFAYALWGPGFADPAAEGELPIRVLSWNVRRLWGGPGANGRPDEIRAATRCVVDHIAAEEPDVVVLLEVTRTDVARLSVRLALSCVHTDYTGEGDDDLGGLAVCTRGQGWTIKGGSGRRYVDDEDWYYVFAEIEREGRVANVLATHLTPYRFGAMPLRVGLDDLAAGDTTRLVDITDRSRAVFRDQGAQGVALMDRIGKLHDPTIISGDFNSTRDTAIHAGLRERLVDTWGRGGRGFGATTAFFGWIPLRVDYIYATPDIAVHSAHVVQADCSDHQGVVADLALPPMDDSASGVQPNGRRGSDGTEGSGGR